MTEVDRMRDLSDRAVSRYENSKIAPGLGAVIRMAEAFNVSVDYLFFDAAERPPQRNPAALSTPASPTSTN